MTDRPIIFTGPMVRALLDGRKTQTRRLATSPLAKCTAGDRLYVRENCWLYGQWRTAGETKTGRVKWTLDLIGQTVCFDPPGTEAVGYQGRGPGFVWRPAMHHPRWASRLTLIVSDVRRQRLQDISEEDAGAEGVYDTAFYDDAEHRISAGATMNVERLAFSILWNHLHAHKPGEAWADNPEIVAVSFQVVRANIDQIEQAA